MINPRKILVMGLPGAGKSTIARALCRELGAVHLNADEIRSTVHKDLGFSLVDRIEHARRLGFWADKIAQAGHVAVADFICPTHETRGAFGRDAFVVFVDRLEKSRYPDTDALFEVPAFPAVSVAAFGEPEYWARIIARELHGAV